MSSRTAAELNAHGEARYREGDREGAHEAFSQAIRADPSHAPAHNNLAVLLWECGKRDEAAALLKRVHDLDPDHREGVLNLGSVLVELGDTARALEVLETYLTEHPDAEVRQAVERLRASAAHPPERDTAPYAHPPIGNTERFIRVETLDVSGSPSSYWAALRDLCIEGAGVGLQAVEAMIRHVFATKLEREPSWGRWRWEETLAVPFRCRIGPRSGAAGSAARAPRTPAEIHPDFAEGEGPERLRCIEEYRALLRGGEDPGTPLYVTGALLERIGGRTRPRDMYMLDGARRIAAAVLEQRETIEVQLLMHESELAGCAAKPWHVALQEDLAGLAWFRSYQSMPIAGLRGERTSQRFDLMDLTLLRDRSVMDFGCHAGQACMKAVLSGASSVVGIEGMADTFAIADRVRQHVGFANLRYLQVDFNDPEFDSAIERQAPGQVDYSFFFSLYRTKELVQRDRLFRYVIDKSRLGVFFEGHAHPKIDTLEYYDWLFESFGLEYEHLGYSEGEQRPLFFLPTRRPVARRVPRPERPGRASLTVDEYLDAGRQARREPHERYLVTAIVSTYASERFLEGRLRDLLAQSLGDRLEIIVIDSGSPEDERSIAESFASRHANVVYRRTERRETVYQAWNRGIQMARGRYITNANTDDRLRPEALEILAGVLEAHPGCAVAYGDFYITGHENQTFATHVRSGYSAKPDFDRALMLSGCHMGPQPMWRRSLHDEFGHFDESLAAAGDYEFWCRVAMRHEMLHVPEFLGVYLHNPEGICNSDDARVQRECAEVQQRYRDRLPEAPAGPVPQGYYTREAVQPERWVNIGMVTFNRLEFTKKALDCLLRWTRFPHAISVVDNGSKDGTREYLLEQKRRGVIRNLLLLDDNVGVAKASNMAWEMEPDAGYFLKYDNDVLVEKDGWLADMVELVDAVPQIGVLGYNFEPVSFDLSEVNDAQLRVKRDGNIGGACILIPRRTRDLLGVWCEEYGLYGEEDADYGTRVMHAGRWNVYMPDERTPFHLPGGRAAAIDPHTMTAGDDEEELHDQEYRLWKDEQRRRNTDPDSPYVRNLAAYELGLRPLLNLPNGAWKALMVLDISFRAQVRADPELANALLALNAAIDAFRFGAAARLASESLPECEERDRLLHKLRSLSRNEPSEPPRVSVVVPAGEARLTWDLHAELQRSALYSPWELVVVESGEPEQCAREGPDVSRVVSPDAAGSFGAACNLGAQAASGEYLAFLNAVDVTPQRGWLAELVRCLLVHPGAGVACSHVIRRDQTWTGDALSSVAFLVGKERFQAEGGLDPCLEPRRAVAELCARVQERGLGVCHASGSLVLERPGATSGDPARLLEAARAYLEAGDGPAALNEIAAIKATRVPLRGVDVLRARCFLKLGRPADAREALKEELHRHPEDAQARRQLEELLALEHRDEAEGCEPEFQELLRAIRPYTMVPMARLRSLYRLARQVCVEDLPGDFVECGVAAGGSSALLASVIRRHSARPRLLWAFDSFEGMPAPTALDTQGGIAADATGWGAGTCAAPVDSLHEVCRRLGVSEVVRAVAGDFRETLPREAERMGEIALLHLDGDWYESTRAILENLWDRVVSGGVLQIDDYGCWDGCRRAVHEFESRNGLSLELAGIDAHGVWTRKGPAA